MTQDSRFSALFYALVLAVVLILCAVAHGDTNTWGTTVECTR